MKTTCDAGKPASADLSAAFCAFAALSLVPIKTALRSTFKIFISVTLHIKDTERLIIHKI